MTLPILYSFRHCLYAIRARLALQISAISKYLREIASEFLYLLNEQLQSKFLFGSSATLTDSAILPFMRQFAFIDKAWFNAQPWLCLQRWLEDFLGSGIFQFVMEKYPKW